MQIGYSTVFIWEYLGPIVVYALIYCCPRLAYSHLRHAHHSSVGKLVPFQECVHPAVVWLQQLHGWLQLLLQPCS